MCKLKIKESSEKKHYQKTKKNTNVYFRERFIL